MGFNRFFGATTETRQTMLKAGTILGNYEVVAPIAAGGMGVVYRARHTMLGSEVALKVLLSNFALSEKVRTRFQQEAYVQANLKHPNIVQVTDMVIDEDTLAIIMELVDGPSLEDVLVNERSTPWSFPDVMAVMDPVFEGVAYAHARSVIHRDLKPANILLDRSHAASGLGVPKVADFGLAKILSSEVGMTRTGARMGTAPYMAPEQFRGQKDIDTRTDVFALGMIMLRLLLGSLPLDPENMEEVFAFYMGKHRLASLSGLRSTSPHLAKILTTALAIAPEKRPRNAELLGTSLHQVPHSATPTTEPIPGANVSLVVGSRPRTRRTSALIAGTVIIAVALLASILAGVFRDTDTEPEQTVPQTAVGPSQTATSETETPQSEYQIAPGMLGVESSTSAAVYVDGQFVSYTPVRNHELSPGQYEVRLVNAEAGIDFVESVVIRSNQAELVVYRPPNDATPSESTWAASEPDDAEDRESPATPALDPPSVQLDPTPIEIAHATASDHIPGEYWGYEFPPDNLVDGRLSTCWQVEGGVGEWFRLSWDETVELVGLEIANGFQHTDDELGDLFSPNSRIASAQLNFSDGSHHQITFGSRRNGYTSVSFDARRVRWVEVAIISVYEGSRWSDLAVSEVRAFGLVPTQ